MAILDITQERAARRFAQISVLDHELQRVALEIVDARATLKALTEQHEMLLRRLRIAARDEGELPLFDDLDER